MAQRTKFVAFHAPLPMADELYRLAAERERTVSGELRLMLRDHLDNIEGRGSARAEPSASEVRVEKEPEHGRH